MILENTLKTRITNLTIDKYIKLGYKCNIGDIIDISIEDCPNSSDVKLTCICDKCKINKKTTNGDVYNKNHGAWICNNCKKEIKENTKCEYCGCGNSAYRKKANMILCNKHYKNWRINSGDIKRTIRDENEIHLYDTYATFDTYDLNGNIVKTYKIDLEDVDFVKTHKCYTHNITKYAIFKKDGKNIALHKYLTNTINNDNVVVDHINRDRYDNRKSNLRITSSLENNLNTGIPSHNTSGIKGVSYRKKDGTYEAYVNKYDKKIGLGSYNTIDKASIARKIGELVIYGDKLLYINRLKEELKDIDIYSHMAYKMAKFKEKELDEKYGK